MCATCTGRDIYIYIYIYSVNASFASRSAKSKQQQVRKRKRFIHSYIHTNEEFTWDNTFTYMYDVCYVCMNVCMLLYIVYACVVVFQPNA